MEYSEVLEKCKYFKASVKDKEALKMLDNIIQHLTEIDKIASQLHAVVQPVLGGNDSGRKAKAAIRASALQEKLDQKHYAIVSESVTLAGYSLLKTAQLW